MTKFYPDPLKLLAIARDPDTTMDMVARHYILLCYGHPSEAHNYLFLQAKMPGCQEDQFNQCCENLMEYAVGIEQDRDLTEKFDGLGIK